MTYYINILVLTITLAYSFLALADILRSRFKQASMMTLSFLLVLLVPLLGAILYFQFKHRICQRGRRRFQLHRQER